ncbi:MAG: cell wall-binding repeat-containing protein [Lachnospiraceae bacterium]|nr:cell wall-binding repeat-containing protein [Lachnospiraceae bacterium]
MNKCLRKCSCLMLALVMMIGLLPLLPAKTVAAEEQTAAIWLNTHNVLLNSEGTGREGGTYHYDAATRTLTLDNYKGLSIHEQGAASFYTNIPLTVVLIGENYFHSGDARMADIEADVTFRAGSTDASLSAGYGRGMEIKNGATVTWQSGNLTFQNGLGDNNENYDLNISYDSSFVLNGGTIKTNSRIISLGRYVQNGGVMSIMSTLTNPSSGVILSSGYVGDKYKAGTATLNGGLLSSRGYLHFQSSSTGIFLKGGELRVEHPTTGALSGYATQNIIFEESAYTCYMGQTAATAEVKSYSKYNNSRDRFVNLVPNQRKISVQFYYPDSNTPVVRTYNEGERIDIKALTTEDYEVRYLTSSDNPYAEFPYYSTAPADGSVLYCRGFSSNRLAGSDRYATCAAIAERAFRGEKPTEAVMVTGKKFPDALAASGFAGAMQIPVLMSGLTKIPDPILNLMTNTWGGSVKHVYLIGMEFEQNVINQLQGMGITVERIGGADRYATADAIYATGANMGIFRSNCCFVATGKKAADALSASTWAYTLGAPMFLVNGKGELTAKARSIISEGRFARVYILGSESINNDRIYAQADLIGFSAVRLGGKDRFQTSALINYQFMNASNPDTAAVSVGRKLGNYTTMTAFAAGRDENFPDALAGGQLAHLYGKTAMMLVSAKETNNAYAENYLRNKSISENEVFVPAPNVVGDNDMMFILGGEPAVATSTQQRLEGAARGYTLGGGVG